MSNIEISSNNPTFKENSSHIDTSKLKPDSNDSYNSRKLTSKEILSKDKLINYLMETQTTILNLVTSAKNQEKTQEKLQKLNVPQQR